MLLTIYTMKKIRLLILAMSVAALAGCTADMDKFTERLDDLEARVAALETLCAQMNEDISSMRTVISALEDGLYITDVKNVSVGYRIEFSDGETITIRHGEDGEDGAPGIPGADGQDGYTPVIGVRMDTDGIYYWTLDGEWLLDDQGNKMRVTGEDGKDGADGEDGKDGEDGADGAPGEPGAPGEDGADGKDGVTPVIGVAQDEDGIYYWTINGEWLLDENGNKVQAQGRDGADGQDGKDGADGEDGKDGADGQDGKDGEDGTSLFSGVDVDDDYVTFTLPDGSSFQIPLEKPLDIIFDVEDMDETVLDTYSELEIGYTVQSNSAEISVEVIKEGDIDVVLKETDELSGVITIYTESYESVEGSKIIVLVGDERRVIMRSITFANLRLSISDINTVSVPAEGGTVNVYYMSNMEWRVNDYYRPEWITVAETKAYTERTITLQIAPNDGNPRSAELLIMNDYGYGFYYTVNQDADPEVQKTVEREALQEIYKAYSGDTWAEEYRTGWNSDLPLDQWAGVELDENGYVSKLTLNLPEGASVSTMPDEIGDLHSLTELCIDGPTTLSANILGCRMLQVIDIYDLYGTIPAELTACTELTYISIKGVNAYGEIPADIGNLAKLRVLDISNTGISGSIPASLGNCTELHTLWLDNNYLSGSIPSELTGCTKLKVIMLHHNSLSGEIPEAIGQMPDLKRLSVYGNQLSGAIPQSLQDNASLWKYSWGYIILYNDFDPESFEVPDWDFVVQDINGNSINSETVYAEHEYTVMLASRISVLEGVVDEFSALYDEYGGRLEIIGYSPVDDAQALSQFATAYSIPFPLVAVSNDNPIIVVDETVGNWNYDLYYPSPYYASIVVVDKNGDVVYYDIDHFLSYSINNLKAFLQSATGMLYESTDYSRDGSYRTLQQAIVGNGIDIVIMGDGYSDRLMTTYDSDAQNVLEQLFSVEPFKSFREYFNVYQLNLVSANEVLSDITSTALETKVFGTSVSYNNNMVLREAQIMFSGLGGESRMDNAVLIALLNHENVAGSGQAYYPDTENDYADGTGIAYVSRSDGEESLKAQLLWEVGFAFTKLAYETGGFGTMDVGTSDNLKQPMESYGWYKNIDITSDPEQVRWAKFINDERYADEGLGVYEGGWGYDYGVWRSSETSIMSGDLAAGFNAPSREAIYYRIHKLTDGADWEYDFEEFVTYDEINRTAAASAASAARTYVRQPVEMPELKVIPMTWREALESSGQPEAHLKSR